MNERTKNDLKHAIGAQYEIEDELDDGKDRDADSKYHFRKERAIKDFWDRRARDSCIWSFFLTFSNFIFQIMNLIKPLTEEQSFIVTLYMIGSVLSFFLLYLHYKKKCKTAYCVCIYVFLRHGIRLLDLERTKPIMSESSWSALLII